MPESNEQERGSSSELVGLFWPRLCEKSRAIVKLDIFSKTLRTFVVLSGIALTGPKCGTLCARTIARIASNLTR